MTVLTGMELDSKKKAGVGSGWMAILVAGMAAMVAVCQAEDVLSGLADPTQPAYGNTTANSAYAGMATPTGPALQSTFVSTSQRLAVISGKSYRVGDKFGGGVITEIEPYEVILKQAGRETRLRLLPKVVKQAYVVKVPTQSQEGGLK
ncbi:MAG: hypothetical protein HY081_11560 [Gammaproteobacteria bacterium]|nr:hypothetical protein [Gammaproteobacteria bacterium]